MRILGPVVEIPARTMPDVGQNGTMSNTVAARAVGNEAPWLVFQSMQKPLEEPLGSRPVPPVLNQDVQYDAVLINGPPQIVQRAPDADEHLVEVPRIAGPRSSPAQSPGEVGTELPTPVSDALVGDHNATFGQDQLDITQAETEDVVQPDRVADDLGRKPVPGIREGLDRHAVSVAHLPLRRQRRLTWQCLLTRCARCSGWPQPAVMPAPRSVSWRRSIWRMSAPGLPTCGPWRRSWLTRSGSVTPASRRAAHSSPHSRKAPLSSHWCSSLHLI